jgi:UBX domain/Thioredoxin-like/UBA-like domain
LIRKSPSGDHLFVLWQLSVLRLAGIMDVPRSLIDHFVMLTNAEPAVATQLLGDNGLDLEAAIASFFAIQEAGGAPVVPTPQAANSAGGVGRSGADANSAALAADEAFARQLAAEAPPAEPDVRAPLPEHVEQMLPGGGRSAVRSRRTYAVDDPFLRSDGSTHGDHLAAIFRVPDDIVCRDDFDASMAKGILEKKWLLVNIQRTGVFACLVLNRDVWGDAAVKGLVASRFVFWQRDESTEDGQRYKQFYPYNDVPHVAVVDPRSGERLRVWGGDGQAIEKETIINALVDFCDSESLEEDAAESTLARFAAARTRPPAAAGPSSAPPTEVIDLDKDRMETEDAQMAAAIAASMESSGGDMADDDDGDDMDATAGGVQGVQRHTSRLLSATDPGLNQDRSLRALQDSEYEQSLQMDRAKAESEKAEAERVAHVQRKDSERAAELASSVEMKRARLPAPPPPDSPEQTTELLIRLPSGKRLQRQFYASNTMRDVYDFVDLESEGELEDGSYNLIVPMPRAAFEDRSITLQDAQLLKRAMLVVERL